jgi:hypothetical protein
MCFTGWQVVVVVVVVVMMMMVNCEVVEVGPWTR